MTLEFIVALSPLGIWLTSLVFSIYSIRSLYFTQGDPDVWMCESTKDDGSDCWEYFLLDVHRQLSCY